MASSPLVTQAIETAEGTSIQSAETSIANLQTTNSENDVNLTNLGQAHFVKGFEAHGVQVVPSLYVSRNKTPYLPGIGVAGLVAIMPTNIGILYMPVSSSPAGV